MIEWIEEWVTGNQTLFTWLVLGSIAGLVLSAILLPVVMVRLPRGYFTERHRQKQNARNRRRSILWHVAKNTLGVIFLLAGVAMLVLPGQGLLTIFFGVLLLDFPGKYRLERWVVLRPGILNAINHIRARFGKPPLEAPEQTAEA